MDLIILLKKINHINDEKTNFNIYGIFFTLTISAHTSIMELLESTVWKNQEDDYGNEYRYFKNNILYIKDFYGNRKYEFDFPFYLSDTIDEEFDYSKVGKNQNGKYLTWVNEDTQIIQVYEIISITEKQLIIHCTKILYGGGERKVFDAYNGEIK